VARHVQSPLQAQQAWQVAVRLQGNPLHKVAGRVLGGAVVALVEVSWQQQGQAQQHQQQQGKGQALPASTAWFISSTRLSSPCGSQIRNRLCAGQS
jgi:hypothetical protein